MSNPDPITVEALRKLGRDVFLEGSISGRFYWQSFGRLEIEFKENTAKYCVYLVDPICDERLPLYEIRTMSQLMALTELLRLPGVAAGRLTAFKKLCDQKGERSGS